MNKENLTDLLTITRLDEELIIKTVLDIVDIDDYKENNEVLYDLGEKYYIVCEKIPNNFTDNLLDLEKANNIFENNYTKLHNKLYNKL